MRERERERVSSLQATTNKNIQWLFNYQKLNAGRCIQLVEWFSWFVRTSSKLALYLQIGNSWIHQTNRPISHLSNITFPLFNSTIIYCANSQLTTTGLCTTIRREATWWCTLKWVAEWRIYIQQQIDHKWWLMICFEFYNCDCNFNFNFNHSRPTSALIDSNWWTVKPRWDQWCANKQLNLSLILFHCIAQLPVWALFLCNKLPFS